MSALDKDDSFRLSRHKFLLPDLRINIIIDYFEHRNMFKCKKISIPGEMVFLAVKYYYMKGMSDPLNY